MDLATNFTSLDWVIVAVYLLISVAVGVLVNRYINRLSDYLVAGRTLRVYLAVATMTGTELGLVTVMYSSENGFLHGPAAFHVPLLSMVCMLVVGFTGFIVYGLRKAEVMTIPEFYEQRFGRTSRWVGGIVLTFSGILNMGLFLQVGAKYVIGLTNLPADGAALKLVMTSMLVLVLIYTVLGGMVAVVITDYLQFVVLSLAMLLVTGYIITHQGLGHIFQAVSLPENLGEGAVNPLTNQEYGPLYLVWQAVTLLAAATLWQSVTVRALAAKSPTVAKRLFAWSSLSFLIRMMIPMFWGIAAYVFIRETPVWRAQFFPTDGSAGLPPMQAMPMYLGALLPTGLLGIVAAGMMAAFMSTHDSYLLCWASCFTQDILAPLRGEDLDERQRILVTRVVVVLTGIFLLVFGLWYEAKQSLWNYMAVTGSIYFSGALTVVVAGMYWKRASRAGALAALLCGFFAVLGVVQPFTDWLKSVTTWNVPAVVGLTPYLICAGVMVVFSLLFPDPPADPEPTAVEAS